MLRSSLTIAGAAILGLAMTTCSSEPQSVDPATEQSQSDDFEVESEPSLVSPDLMAQEGAVEPDTDTNASTTDRQAGMASGNADGARQPDPKRSKLIKADPN